MSEIDARSPPNIVNLTSNVRHWPSIRSLHFGLHCGETLGCCSWIEASWWGRCEGIIESGQFCYFLELRYEELMVDDVSEQNSADGDSGSAHDGVVPDWRGWSFGADVLNSKHNRPDALEKMQYYQYWAHPPTNRNVQPIHSWYDRPKSSNFCQLEESRFPMLMDDPLYKNCLGLGWYRYRSMDLQAVQWIHRFRRGIKRRHHQLLLWMYRCL